MSKRRMRRLLVAVDGSDSAKHGLKHALKLAKEHGNTTDVVFHLSGLGHVARCRGSVGSKLVP